MPIVRALPELEESLTEVSSACELLADREYKRLVAHWKSAFGPLVESRSRRLTGSRALESVRSRLPATVFLFSGIRIPEVANLGGRGAVGYRVADLERMDSALLRSLELVVVAEDFAWSCLFSHETGSLVHEELYELASRHPRTGEP